MPVKSYFATTYSAFWAALLSHDLYLVILPDDFNSVSTGWVVAF